MNKFAILENIYFQFENQYRNVFQLSNFSLTINRNQKIAVMGNNGSGKTTLLKILNGLLFPSKGTYYFQDQLITKKTLRNKDFHKFFRKNCVMLFQNTDLMLFHSEVYDDLAFGLRQLKYSNIDIENKVSYFAEIFQIRELLKENPLYLSGGQKKRVALATLFILEPELILLDEPFNELDAGYSQFLIDFIKNLDSTIIFTSHDMELTKEITEEIICM
jgi:cobalt/nickel transport system ATP-binding protein